MHKLSQKKLVYRLNTLIKQDNNYLIQIILDNNKNCLEKLNTTDLFKLQGTILDYRQIS